VKQDIILAGVGGQGILSIAFVIDHAALKEGLKIKQAEVHGMAQRGGAVQSHLRLSDAAIHSDLIPKGSADIVLSVEPLESLRYLAYLKPGGRIITSSTPMLNIPDYPDLDGILGEIRRVPGSILVDSGGLAREAGSARAQNMVMLGAASHYLGLEEADLLEFIEVLFRDRGEKTVEINRRAFHLGRRASEAAGMIRRQPR
jgi:indolepyruvate ferredoxin oxidoreductase beta subunit